MQNDTASLILRLLNENRIMTIATNRPDGWPQATVVGYANDGFVLYTFVARDGQKFANIARDPRVSIAIAHDYPQPLEIKGLSMAAHVTLVDRPEEFQRVLGLMAARYPEYKALPLPNLEEVPVLRITPEVISVLDYAKGFGHSDLVTVTRDDLAKAGHLAAA